MQRSIIRVATATFTFFDHMVRGWLETRSKFGAPIFARDGRLRRGRGVPLCHLARGWHRDVSRGATTTRSPACQRLHMKERATRDRLANATHEVRGCPRLDGFKHIMTDRHRSATALHRSRAPRRMRRTTDTVRRQGGEEFSCCFRGLLPEDAPSPRGGISTVSRRTYRRPRLHITTA